MAPTTSPRLPGVPQLQLHFSGPEYSRWRRSIKFALQAKGTWKYCNGSCPMPMPRAATSPKSTPDSQPSLLDERRDWVRHDREAKLDIFLSLSEDVMQEVLEVGPPLPPSNLNAQEMLEHLDERYAVFKFEPYHHAFCHFLNLHIDQFSSLAEFNQEFATTLEDLVDHGQPLSNIQACSAYFSKLRCTQNPWVAEKLEEWDAQGKETHYTDLLRESPPWSIVRPLAAKPSRDFQVESIPEENLEDSLHSDSDIAFDSPDSSTISSVSALHSRNTSNISLKTAGLPDIHTEREDSTTTPQSQEITILASIADIAEIKPEAKSNDLQQLAAPTIPERGSSKNRIPERLLTDDYNASIQEQRLIWNKSGARPLLSLDRPLPPLPTQSLQAKDAGPRSATHSKQSSQGSIPTPSSSSSPPQLKLETTHPTLRPTTPILPVEIHPALRPTAPTDIHPALRPTTSPSRPVTSLPFYSSPSLRRPSISPLNLAIPWPSTPDFAARPHSSSTSTSASPHSAHSPTPSQTHTPDTAQHPPFGTEEDSDEIYLPLQGTRDSAWSYLYEAKGGYLIHQAGQASSVSPVSSTGPLLQRRSLLTQSLGRVPTYEDAGVAGSSASTGRGTSRGLDFVMRLSGDGLVESSEEGREREKRDRQRKKKSWGGVDWARFSSSKGVREVIRA